MPPRPKSPFPDPAATLPGEADILANVLTNLADHDAKLVYADWLEERDDPRGPLLRKSVVAHRAGKRLPALSAAPKSWRELVGLTLIGKIRAAGLAPLADAVLALARPALAIASVATAEKSLAVGASKYGGHPDLPAGAKWPKFEGASLAFLGQFNLADLHPSPAARELPATGLLSVFCAYRGDDDDDFPKGSWRLLHFPDATKLARREPDADLPGESRFPSCRVWFAERLTVPPDDAPQLTGLLEATEGAADAYADLFVDIRLGDHILGHIFEPPKSGRNGLGVRHLLTIGANDDTEWEFGVGGELCFTLPEADLKAGRFDRLKMDMDCV